MEQSQCLHDFSGICNVKKNFPEANNLYYVLRSIIGKNYGSI